MTSRRMLPALHILQRFLSKEHFQQRLLLEAAFYLVAAHCFISLLPFRYLSAFLGRKQMRVSVPYENGTELADKISWAVISAARYIPLRLVCFHKGIAVFLMLRQRRVDIRLMYGILRQNDELVSHVWVTYGNKDVIGCEQADEYTVLMTYPKDD